MLHFYDLSPTYFLGVPYNVTHNYLAFDEDAGRR